MNPETIAAGLTEAGKEAVRTGYCDHPTLVEVMPLVFAYRILDGGDVSIALNHTGLLVRRAILESRDAE